MTCNNNDVRSFKLVCFTDQTGNTATQSHIFRKEKKDIYMLTEHRAA